MYKYFFDERLTVYVFFLTEHQRNFTHSVFFSAFCPSPYLALQWLFNITYCLPGIIWMSCGPPVQVGVCLGCCLESRGGRTVNLRAPDVTQRLRPVFLSLPLFSFLLSLSLSLSSSTLPPSLPCCLSVSTFPVVVWDMASGRLGCQLLPAHTVTSSPATSAPHANAAAGHCWAFILSRFTRARRSLF